MTSAKQPCLTIVVPTYSLHFGVVTALVESIAANVLDPESLVIRLVVERENLAFVEELGRKTEGLTIEALDTESILQSFGVSGSPADALASLGKFTFQSLKKIGGCLSSGTEWVLVMDSESLFLKPFKCAQLLDDYRTRKYVFYSNVEQRGSDWAGSLSDIVTRNACRLVGGQPDRWFMEYYHWFYERSIWRDLIEMLRSNGGLEDWLVGGLPRGIFENVLYYTFVSNNPRYGYAPTDIVAALQSLLPEAISSRVKPALLGRFTVVGIVEHIVSLISIDEIPALKPLFSSFSLPFLRFEPNIHNPGFIQAIEALPSVVALVSSHRIEVESRRIAVCVAGEFRSVYSNMQSIRSFLTGVECDLFVHCWNDDLVPIINGGLQPFALCVEDRPDFRELAQAIAKHEPMLKEGRDAGSLAMLYAIQQSLAMIDAHEDRYNYVVRIRPDTFYQESLRDLLFAVADDEVGGKDVVYLPNSFHSQGVNDQFAIGKTAAMRRYGKVFDYTKRRIGKTYFNPEHVFAGHLIEQNISIKALPMHYVLLRSEPANIDWIGHLQRLQRETWWSAVLPGPWKIREATELFRAKHGAMEFMYRTNGWDEATFLLEAGNFSADSQRFLDKPFVKICVAHDFKNPDVTIKAQVSDGERFVAVGKGELRLVPDRPEGIFYLREGREDGQVRFTHFEDNLGKAAADLHLTAHDPARFPEAAFLQTVDLGSHEHGVALETDREPLGGDGAVSLQRSAMQLFVDRPVPMWRRLRAHQLLRRARASRRGGRLTAARDLYRRVLQLNPLLGREWVQYGHALKDSGDWRGAVSAYASALFLMPDDVDATKHYEAARAHAV